MAKPRRQASIIVARAAGETSSLPQPLPARTQGAKWYENAGYHPWGVDQSKRTPIPLVVPWLADRLDALEARVTAVEAA